MPGVLVGAIAIGSWIPTVAASADTPALASISAAQLLAKASHPTVKAFSGAIDLTANLGLPDLSSVTGEGGQSAHSASGFDPTTLLSGTHQVNVWDSGAGQQRLALPSSMAETDLVHHGDQAYLYDSSTQTVTRLVGAPHRGTRPADPNEGATGGVPVTPEQAAQRFLDHIDPSTSVNVTSPVYVAGRSAYRLSLGPKPGTPGAAASTVSNVTMSVDSETGMVLAVGVDPRGSQTPALSLAFTSLDLSTPAASNFDAPSGTTTKTKVVHGGHECQQCHQARPDTQSGTQVAGAPWAQVLTIDHANLGKASHQLDSVTTPASGSFGSARLLSTNLINALVFPDGKVVAGFVTPAALEAAAPAGG